MRYTAIVFISLLFMPGFCRANAAVMFSLPHPWGGARLHVAKDNGLKIRKETVAFEVQPDGLNATVHVEYQVENTRLEPFDGVLFFVVPSANNVEYLDTFSVQEGVIQETEKTVVSGLKINANVKVNRIFEKYRGNIDSTQSQYYGFRIPFRIRGKEIQKVVFAYLQTHGHELDDNKPSFAETSHWINHLKYGGGYTPTYYFNYFMFPILTFTEGVEEVVIRVTLPKRSSRKGRVTGFQSNIELRKIAENEHTKTYEGRFTDVPEDIFEFLFYVNRQNLVGFTINPSYKFALPERHHAFAVALSFDAIIRNIQLSLGAQYGTKETFQLIEEVKIFPPGAAFGFISFFDYRFAIGVIEQLTPHLDVGFRFSAGFRIFLALELTYQMFPPMITEEWTHEILIGMPFSF